MKNPFQVAREQAGLSLMQAAIKSGISKETIHRIEKGRVTPGLSTAAMLADAYKASLDQLAGRAPLPADPAA